MSSNNEEPDPKRGDVLLRWQENLDERINKTLFWIFILTVFYVYYGLVSPVVIKGRIERMKSAVEVLDTITNQFNSLSKRYSVFVSPPSNAPSQSASDMGLFIDKLIPAIRTQQLTKSERARVELLEADMKVLSKLYNNHIRVHQSSVGSDGDETNEFLKPYLRNFRRALGTIVTAESTGERQSNDPVKTDNVEGDQLEDEEAAIFLQSAVSGGDIHLIVPNDPVYDLESLAKLEDVIKDLNALSSSKENEDYTLADKARQALFSVDQGGEIQIGDTLTRTFPAYRNLSKYTALNDEEIKKKYPLGLSTSSYKEIANLLNPPFKVNTVTDLSRLKAFASIESDRLSAEYRAPNLKVPFTDATIDRDIVLAAGPFFMVFLLHLLNSYMCRRRNLIEEIRKDASGSLRDSDYQRLGPRSILGTINTGKVSGSAKRLGRTLGDFAGLSSFTIQFILIRVAPVLIPISIIMTLLYNLLNTQRQSSQLQSVLWLSFVASSLLMTAEMYVILKLLSSSRGELAYQPPTSTPAT